VCKLSIFYYGFKGADSRTKSLVDEFSDNKKNVTTGYFNFEIQTIILQALRIYNNG
jgi:hypothetical protein